MKYLQTCALLWPYSTVAVSAAQVLQREIKKGLWCLQRFASKGKVFGVGILCRRRSARFCCKAFVGAVPRSDSLAMVVVVVVMVFPLSYGDTVRLRGGGGGGGGVKNTRTSSCIFFLLYAGIHRVVKLQLLAYQSCFSVAEK